MSQRQVLQVFEQYQRARSQFAQAVADLAARPQSIDTLRSAALCKVQRLEFPMKPALICRGNSTFRRNKFLYRLYKLFLNSSMLSAGRLAQFRRDLILLYCCHGMS